MSHYGSFQNAIDRSISSIDVGRMYLIRAVSVLCEEWTLGQLNSLMSVATRIPNSSSSSWQAESGAKWEVIRQNSDCELAALTGALRETLTVVIFCVNSKWAENAEGCARGGPRKADGKNGYKSSIVKCGH